MAIPSQAPPPADERVETSTPKPSSASEVPTQNVSTANGAARVTDGSTVESAREFGHSPQKNYAQYDFAGHVKQSSSINPTEAASIFVGLGMFVGGLFVILLQMAKEFGEPRSIVALTIGLSVALVGVVVLGLGLRRARRVVIPVTLAACFASLAAFGLAMVPPTDPDSKIAQNNSADETSEEKEIERDEPEQKDPDPPPIKKRNDTKDPFTTDREKRVNNRKATKPDNTIRRNTPTREKESQNPFTEVKPIDREPKIDTGNARVADNDDRGEGDNCDGGFGKGIRNVESFSSPDAKAIDKLWKSTEPSRRHLRVDEMKDLISDGIGYARGAESDFWRMYQHRLALLKTFRSGDWSKPGFDYVSTGEALKVESSEFALIDSRKTTDQGVVIATSNLYYGSVTIQAELQFVDKDSNTDACEVGIVFSTSDNPAKLTGDEYAVAFDSGFTKISAGTIESLGKQKQAADSTLRIEDLPDSDRPIALQINACRGYVQVIANKQVLIEKFDPRIKGINSIGFAVLPSAVSRYAFRVGKCRVREWKTGMPPGEDGFVEEDLMYYPDAINEFDDQPWFHYRLALAQFGTRKFAAAAESARTAERLGFPSERLALFFAMEHEVNRDATKVIEAYTSSRPGPRRGGSSTRKGKRFDTHELAVAWHAWFVLTHPDPAVRENSVTRTLAPNFHPEPWVVTRVQAALAAHKGDFVTAAGILSGAVSDVPIQFRPEANDQLNAYRAKKQYFRDRGKVPFYHDIKIRIEPDAVRYESPEPQ